MRLLRGRGLSRRVRCLVVAASLRRLAGLWFSWYQLYLRFLFAWNMGAPLHRAESDSDDRCRACGCAYFKLGLRCFRSSVPWTQLLRVSSFLYVYIYMFIYIYIYTYARFMRGRKVELVRPEAWCQLSPIFWGEAAPVSHPCMLCR